MPWVGVFRPDTLVMFGAFEFQCARDRIEDAVRDAGEVPALEENAEFQAYVSSCRE